jgi:hypothetical protein
MLASLSTFLAGVLCLADDAKDLGKFNSPEHPSPLHHWQLAIPLMLLGAGGIGLSTLEIISRLPPPSRKPPAGLLEQGATVEELEAMK